MSTSAFWAPVHRLLQRGPTNSQPNWTPPNASPSLDYASSGLQDHRLAWNKFGSQANTGIDVIGWHGAGDICVIDQVPSAIATANIAALANATSGTAMTLVNTTGAGITVLASATLFWPSLNTVPANACVIDLAPAQKIFGVKTRSAFYDRTTMIGRALSITGVSGGTGGAFLVSGYDVYGYPMTEQITAGAGVSTVNGKKAWKAVVSVTPQFTDAHTYSVGTADIYGFGIQAPLFSDVQIWWNNAVITANTGFVVPDTTTPATTTTGDVRGTYAVQTTASDGTRRLVVLVRPPLGLIQTNATTGLFGVAQT